MTPKRSQVTPKASQSGPKETPKVTPGVWRWAPGPGLETGLIWTPICYPRCSGRLKSHPARARPRARAFYLVGADVLNPPPGYIYIYISRSIATMSEFIKCIGEEGFKYGMKLNKTTCELLTNSPNARIVFPGNGPVKNTNQQHT